MVRYRGPLWGAGYLIGIILIVDGSGYSVEGFDYFNPFYFFDGIWFVAISTLYILGEQKWGWLQERGRKLVPYSGAFGGFVAAAAVFSLGGLLAGWWFMPYPVDPSFTLFWQVFGWTFLVGGCLGSFGGLLHMLNVRYFVCDSCNTVLLTAEVREELRAAGDVFCPECHSSRAIQARTQLHLDPVKFPIRHEGNPEEPAGVAPADEVVLRRWKAFCSQVFNPAQKGQVPRVKYTQPEETTSAVKAGETFSFRADLRHTGFYRIAFFAFTVGIIAIGLAVLSFYKSSEVLNAGFAMVVLGILFAGVTAAWELTLRQRALVVSRGGFMRRVFFRFRFTPWTDVRRMCAWIVPFDSGFFSPSESQVSKSALGILLTNLHSINFYAHRYNLRAAGFPPPAETYAQQTVQATTGARWGDNADQEIHPFFSLFFAFWRETQTTGLPPPPSSPLQSPISPGGPSPGGCFLAPQTIELRQEGAWIHLIASFPGVEQGGIWYLVKRRSVLVTGTLPNGVVQYKATIPLPVSVQSRGAKAAFRNGTLEMRLPKRI